MHSPNTANHINHHEMVSDSTLHVVAVISNPVRFHSRYRLFKAFEAEMLATPNVKLHVVEIAQGDHHFEVTSADNPSHLQLRTSEELWTKESMINRGVRHLLPRDWKYLCWADADISFHNKNWARDTISQLQRWHVVQPWGQCIDLGPKGDIVQMHTSFAKAVHGGEPIRLNVGDNYYKFAHMGYSTACTRQFYEEVDGLIDWGILGSGDAHMSYAMINHVDSSINGDAHDNYKKLAREWQHRAFRVTNGHMGVIHGFITHHWHGRKKDRRYKDRWKILVEHKFDPINDLRRDHQGLYKLIGKPQLQEDIRHYFSARLEDSIDIE